MKTARHKHQASAASPHPFFGATPRRAAAAWRPLCRAPRRIASAGGRVPGKDLAGSMREPMAIASTAAAPLAKTNPRRRHGGPDSAQPERVWSFNVVGPRLGPIAVLLLAVLLKNVLELPLALFLLLGAGAHHALALLLLVLRQRPSPLLHRDECLLLDEAHLSGALLAPDGQTLLVPRKPLRVLLAVVADRLLPRAAPQLIHQGDV
mmetsp:Transcript_121221/g.343009  ORF Transcript_121221/g.343009 Transcript_121221/m.343009 type:complete len:207 (+) Transcript_121221:104-724(+)